MAAGYHHFIIEQGATFSHTLTLKDSSGTVINLTGYPSAEMDLRKNQDDSSEVLTLTTANGRIALGGSAGTITLEISNTDTSALTVGDGVYDLELVDSENKVLRIMEGTYSIRGNVSR
tara:strand:+ start:1451 stop:1804 length:354 start_codon:yes stop_codon:yes gene_type:complete